ncbi:MAG: methyl-accepting chemotaxis protein [Pseudomonadota bacterium]
MRMLHRLMILAAAPLLVMSLFSLQNFGDALSQRNNAQAVVNSVEDAGATSALVHYLQRERGASVGYTASNGRRFANDLPNLRRDVDAAASAFLEITGDQASLTAIDRVRSAVEARTSAPAAIGAAYTDIIATLLTHAETALEKASDPLVAKRADAFSALVWAKEYAGRERAVGAAGFSAGFTPARYKSFVSLAEAQRVSVQEALTNAAKNDVSAIERLATSRAQANVDEFRASAQSNAFTGASVSGALWFDASTARIDEMKAVEDQLAATLTNEARAVAARGATALVFVLVLTIVSIAASAGITYFFAKAISKQLNQLGAATRKIAAGNYETKVPGASRKDEIGTIAKSLRQFRDDAASSAEANKIAVFKGTAFDGSSQPMIMVDRDFIVTFVNEATKQLFRDHREEFRVAFPTFDPENIVGSCIDVFHKNPAHQRQMMADASRLPFHTDISLGDLKFSLNVSGVFDENGEYVGNTLEWRNVTAERTSAGVLRALDSSQAIIEFSPDGTIRKANENFLNTMGYSMQDIEGKHHSMFCDPDFARTEEYKSMWKRLAMGESIHGKFQRFGKGGKPVWLRASYSAVVDGKGELFRVVKLATDITQIEEDRIQVEKERKARAEELEVVIGSLAEGLTGLSDGDLTREISTPFAQTYEQIRTNFNVALVKLQESITSVIQNTDGIRTGAGEISQAADDLSRRTENQAATLEETAASLEELTASVRAAAEGAEKANQVVIDAKKNAETSGVVVREAVGAMGEIERSSQQISQIISVIDDIAFQTNLLALNAGVEAARAGDAGRGFAVVASEVRALAQRSSDAAKEIKTLISASSQHVERGVDLVGQTGEALEEIVTSVASISKRVSDIATSAREQSTGIAEINVAMNQMDQVTQQNAAMVEESTAASHSLTQEAEQLGQIVSRFKTANSPGLSMSPSAPSSAPAPVHQQQERAQAFAASQPRTQGATALKADPVADDDDWEDF